MVEFRRSLAASFLLRFFIHVGSQLEADLPGWQPIFQATFKSAARSFERPPVQGLQYYSKVPGQAVVGQPTRHMAADLQVLHSPQAMTSSAALLIATETVVPLRLGCIGFYALGLQNSLKKTEFELCQGS